MRHGAWQQENLQEWRKWAEPIASISCGCQVAAEPGRWRAVGPYHYPTHSTITMLTHVATTFGWTMALEMAASLMMASG